MRKTTPLLIFLFFFCSAISSQTHIRLNLIGFKPDGLKRAVVISKDAIEIDNFEIIDFFTDKTVFRSTDISDYGEWGNFKSTFRLRFDNLREKGVYYISAGGAVSPIFRIAEDIYNGGADFILNYMRQQRCGFNPFLNDSCHTNDGFIIYHPEYDSSFIDVVGGWHDASDYLQYVTTSANAVYQMLFAYESNRDKYSDLYGAEGLPGSNGIPDILDEAVWGLKWLLKMNPGKDFMFNQIADDRDHQGFKLPTRDSISYGKGLERPVYFVTGEPQGVMKYQNRTEGVSSTAGKYASAFALGSRLLKDIDPGMSEVLRGKSLEAFEFGESKPGVCQTAPCRAPYFYEEDNWTDDMELAAAEIALLTGDDKYLEKAAELGRAEPVTPWMGKDTARHYQWYPFMNLGHFRLAENGSADLRNEFIEYLRRGIEAVAERGKDNPFLFGVPFIWCSNNLTAAIATQSLLYRELTGSVRYAETESALIDWLFGCNPWGISMIIGLPGFGKYPLDPHSAFSHLHGFELKGGLVDGPVYSTIFNNLKGVTIYNGDEYSEVQPGEAVYHDDWGDYSTNEPTMDGTASLSYLLSALESGEERSNDSNSPEYSHGAVIRTDKSQKRINLIFSGDEFGDGLPVITKSLGEKEINASFFFTGRFLRDIRFEENIRELVKEGHYIGAHSDRHLLYAPWDNRDSLLVTREEFLADLKANYNELRRFGITPEDAPYFLPPYEWYNEKIADWCAEIGLKLISFSPGTGSNQDWTTPDLNEKYVSSDRIIGNILAKEATDPYGLNGFILLLHVGAHPSRTDHLYRKLDEILDHLLKKGYEFAPLKETI